MDRIWLELRTCGQLRMSVSLLVNCCNPLGRNPPGRYGDNWGRRRESTDGRRVRLTRLAFRIRVSRWTRAAVCRASLVRNLSDCHHDANRDIGGEFPHEARSASLTADMSPTASVAHQAKAAGVAISPPVLPGRSPPTGLKIVARGQRPRALAMRASSRPPVCSGCPHAPAGVAPRCGQHAGASVVERAHPADRLTRWHDHRRETWQRSQQSCVSGTSGAVGSLCTSRSS